MNQSTTPAIEAVATDIWTSLPRSEHRGPLVDFAIIDLIVNLIKQIMTSCGFNDPKTAKRDAWSWLTREPRWFEPALNIRRSFLISRAVKKHWNNDIWLKHSATLGEVQGEIERRIKYMSLPLFSLMCDEAKSA